MEEDRIVERNKFFTKASNYSRFIETSVGTVFHVIYFQLYQAVFSAEENCNEMLQSRGNQFTEKISQYPVSTQGTLGFYLLFNFLTLGMD